METKICKRKPVVSLAKVEEALGAVVQWYDGHEMCNTTWKFWIKTVTDYLNGRLSTKQFKNVDVPEPKEDEEIGNGKIRF